MASREGGSEPICVIESCRSARLVFAAIALIVDAFTTLGSSKAWTEAVARRRKEKVAKACLTLVMLKDDDDGDNGNEFDKDNESLKRGAYAHCGQDKIEPNRLTVKFGYVSG